MFLKQLNVNIKVKNGENLGIQSSKSNKKGPTNQQSSIQTKIPVNINGKKKPVFVVNQKYKEPPPEQVYEKKRFANAGIDSNATVYSEPDNDEQSEQLEADNQSEEFNFKGNAYKQSKKPALLLQRNERPKPAYQRNNSIVEKEDKFRVNRSKAVNVKAGQPMLAPPYDPYMSPRMLNYPLPYNYPMHPNYANGLDKNLLFIIKKYL